MKARQAKKILKGLRVVNFKQGDYLVAKINPHSSDLEIHECSRALREFGSDFDVKVIVTTGDVELSVLRGEDSE